MQKKRERERECSEIFGMGTVIGRVGACLIAEFKLRPDLHGGLAR